MKRIAALLIVLAACNDGTYVKLEFTNIPANTVQLGCNVDLGDRHAGAVFRLDEPAGVGSNHSGSLQFESGAGALGIACEAFDQNNAKLGTASGTVTVVRGKTASLTLSFGAVQTDAGQDMATGDMATGDMATGDMTVLTPMITIMPSGHDYGTLTINTTSTAVPFTVTNNGSAATPPLTVGTDNGAFVVSDGGTCQGMTLAAGGSCQFSVVFAPTVAGATAGHVTATYSGIIGNAPFSMVSGTAVPPGALSWVSPNGTFSDEIVNQASAPTTFTLKNTGGATSGTIAISLTGNDPTSFEISNDTCTGTTLDAGLTCTVDIDFKPTKPGTLAATLQADATPGGTATTSLDGNGFAGAALTLTPDTSTTPHDFGTVDIQSASGTFTLTVANTGDVATGALGFTLPSGVAAVSGSDCMSGQAIAANSSCTLVLTYTPSTYGPASTSITFTASPGGTQTANLSITGRDYITVAVAPLPADGGEITEGTNLDCSSTSTMCQFVYARTMDLTLTLMAAPAATFAFSSWTYMNSPPPCADATSAMCVVTFDSSVTGSATSTPSATPFTYDANFM